MTTAMSVVLAKASERNIKIELVDKRTLYLGGRPCQAITSKWYESFKHCTSMTMYMPRNNFADFLLYFAAKPEGPETVYVVPRGRIAHDTSWAESALEPYKEAWHLLKDTSPLLFERKVEALSPQLEKIIAEAQKRNLSYELIRTKRSKSRDDCRQYMQRRLVIQGKNCAIFTASLMTESSHPWPTVHLRVPFDDWAEFYLYIRNDDVYVMPKNQVPHQTTLDLESSRIFDYKNSWSVLDGVDPTTSVRGSRG